MEVRDEQQISFECSRLLTAYAQAVDCGDVPALLAVFGPDATFISGKTRLSGHDEIATLPAGRPPTLQVRHLVGTIHVDVADAETASAVSYYAVFNGTHGADGRPAPMELPFSMGEWHSAFRRTRDGWRITRHEVRRLFQRRKDGG